MKDIYISDGSQRALTALGLTGSLYSGLLIGHKRGERFHIEEILPFRFDSSDFDGNWSQLDSIYNDGIIGFFSSQMDEKQLRPLLSPACFGKIFLLISTNENKTQAFLIEYDKKFYFSPVDNKVSDLKNLGKKDCE